MGLPNASRETKFSGTNVDSLADHVQDWQPYPVDPYSCYMCGHTYIFYHKYCGSIQSLQKVL